MNRAFGFCSFSKVATERWKRFYLFCSLFWRRYRTVVRYWCENKVWICDILIKFCFRKKWLAVCQAMEHASIHFATSRQLVRRWMLQTSAVELLRDLWQKSMQVIELSSIKIIKIFSYRFDNNSTSSCFKISFHWTSFLTSSTAASWGERIEILSSTRF